MDRMDSFKQELISLLENEDRAAMDAVIYFTGYNGLFEEYYMQDMLEYWENIAIADPENAVFQIFDYARQNKDWDIRDELIGFDAYGRPYSKNYDEWIDDCKGLADWIAEELIHFDKLGNALKYIFGEQLGQKLYDEYNAILDDDECSYNRKPAKKKTVKKPVKKTPAKKTVKKSPTKKTLPKRNSKGQFVKRK